MAKYHAMVLTILRDRAQGMDVEIFDERKKKKGKHRVSFWPTGWPPTQTKICNGSGDGTMSPSWNFPWTLSCMVAERSRCPPKLYTEEKLCNC